MSDDIRFLGSLALFIGVVVVGVFLFMYWFMASACDAQWFEFEHRFGVFEGCMVRYEGTWYPEEVVRTVIEP